jgi:hypothetical protein
MDWNLFKPRARFRFLRDELGYQDDAWVSISLCRGYYFDP